MKESDYLAEHKRVIADLKKISVFKPLREEEIQHLLRMSKFRMYRSGETIIEEGSVDFWIYFLIYGRVKISKENQAITILKRRGDVFGEMRFIDSSPRFASVTADGETVCLAVDTDHIDKLAGDDKVVFGYILYRIIAEILAERLRQATKKLMQVQGKTFKFWD